MASLKKLFPDYRNNDWQPEMSIWPPKPEMHISISGNMTADIEILTADLGFLTTTTLQAITTTITTGNGNVAAKIGNILSLEQRQDRNSDGFWICGHGKLKESLTRRLRFATTTDSRKWQHDRQNQKYLQLCNSESLEANLIFATTASWLDIYILWE